MTRPLHDWRDPKTIQLLREMVRAGFSDRAVAWRFGYASPSSLLRALSYPGCEEAVQALTEGYIEAEAVRLKVMTDALCHPNPQVSVPAAKWLDERALKQWVRHVEDAQPKTPEIDANFTDAELLATLRPGDMQ